MESATLVAKSLWNGAVHDLKNNQSAAKRNLGQKPRKIPRMTFKKIKNLGKRLTSFSQSSVNVALVSATDHCCGSTSVAKWFPISNRKTVEPSQGPCANGPEHQHVSWNGSSEIRHSCGISVGGLWLASTATRRQSTGVALHPSLLLCDGS